MPTVLVTSGTSVFWSLGDFAQRRGWPGPIVHLVKSLQRGRKEAEGKELLQNSDEGKRLLRDFMAEEGWTRASEPKALFDVVADRASTDVRLLHAGNVASTLAAEVLARGLEQQFASVALRPLEMVTQRFDTFHEEGYERLCAQLAGQLKEAIGRDAQAPRICLAGGFTIVQALTAVMGQLVGSPLVYRYDLDGSGSTKAVELDPLPIGVHPGKLSRAVDERPDELTDGVQSLSARPLIKFYREAQEEQERHLNRANLRNRSEAELEGFPAAKEASRRLEGRNRVHNWVYGAELWLGDPLPQMVAHGTEHSRGVDRLAMDLVFTARQHGYRDFDPQMLDALTSAAWLHDIGHVGGLIGGHYLRDYQHVRNAHGMLSRRLIRERNDIFPDPEDRELRQLVALLCEHHQRFRPLDAEEAPKGFKTCQGENDTLSSTDPVETCPTCEAVKKRSGRTLEAELLEDQHLDDETTRRWVRVAAILRVADACDNGRHRVAGRHLQGDDAWQKIWRREFAQDLRERTRPDGDLRQAIVAYLERPTREAPDVIEALQARGWSAEADRFAASLKWLDGQERHRARHEPIETCRIRAHAGEGFDLEVVLDNTYRDDGAAVTAGIGTADYVYGEYHQVQHLMEKASLPLKNVKVLRGTEVVEELRCDQLLERKRIRDELEKPRDSQQFSAGHEVSAKEPR